MTRARVWRSATALVIAASVVTVGLALHASQQKSRRGVADRFAARGGLAADFVSTYVSQLMDRETAVATATLSGPSPDVAFASDVSAFAFPAALLLDGEGRVLAVAPASPKLIGQAIADRYAHLAAAVQGQRAVSNMVPSAVQSAPVIAFAVPFSTPTGRRVLSGAYTITDTPLSAFLNDTTTLAGARVYLVDSQGTVIASNGSAVNSTELLSLRDPSLAKATLAGERGSYGDSDSPRYFVRSVVAGTGWSLIISAPSSEIFVSVNSGKWVPWALLFVLSLLAAFAGWLGLRILNKRHQLSAANSELSSVNDRLVDLNAQLNVIARIDSLSGLLTRRSLTEALEKELAGAARHGYAVTVLMVDIDHFKQLNDTYGHLAGDHAIRHIAERLTTSLRLGDLLGRWGGEEFLAVLPHTDLSQAAVVAERMCDMLAGTPIEIGEGAHLVTVQTSIGMAEYLGDSPEGLVSRADVALYEAKAAGRNTVRAAR